MKMMVALLVLSFSYTSNAGLVCISQQVGKDGKVEREVRVEMTPAEGSEKTEIQISKTSMSTSRVKNQSRAENVKFQPIDCQQINSDVICGYDFFKFKVLKNINDDRYTIKQGFEIENLKADLSAEVFGTNFECSTK